MPLGNLYIVSAPSGAGKSSLISALLQQQPSYEMQVSISHTTRQPRPNEEHGKHYYFVDHKEFERLIAEDAFLEYAEVFGNYYGTSLPMIERSLKQGIDVFLDIDWQGAQQVRKKVPAAKSIFILPPSLQELERRLVGRGQDSNEVIAARMKKAINEISHYDEYDYLIINDDFDQALSEIKVILKAEKLRVERQVQRHQLLISQLLAKSE
ncbi:guanylate kinase [Gallibacterium anatis]|uniref:Guanylate kinase n=3 Tax=Gallibacterium anatis TaxID=750 RepID=U1GZP7_9PAST|nr:guanylate kinase [Gallibacterium anatis]ERF77626.1 guanylate kinase [Gallibacterium anatis 12656/12]KGQ24244.1 guanylate kinase [Gallibacterium anatis]KGQ24779.1 guanylate kinase [Gallibacterium anatis]KGQ26768.1 guanylate kinase [Gallibacterium anatis CCM5995]KGQ43020.1 guanylate kinase [Gallibacterium anatis]